MFFCQKLALQDRDCDEGLELLEPLAMKTWSNCTGQGQGESKSLDPLEVRRWDHSGRRHRQCQGTTEMRPETARAEVQQATAEEVAGQSGTA